MARKALLASVVFVVVLVAAFLASRAYRSGSPSVPAVVLDSAALESSATRVVATLATPIEKGKNVIWCASFVAAWKHLQNDLAGEPVALEGDPEACALLNQAPDPSADVPPGVLYATAGWEDQGIIGKSHDDLRKLFPGKAPPEFPGIELRSFVAYGYLEAYLRFKLPYYQNRKPLNLKCLHLLDLANID